MSKYLFLLGNTPELSKLELKALFPDLSWFDFNEELLGADFSDSQKQIAGHEAEIMENLGGTVKILQVIDDNLGVSLTAEDLSQKVVDYFSDRSGRVKLAISELGRDHLPAVESRAIKSALEEKGLKVRYIEASRHGVGAAILIHKHNIEELYFVQNENGEVWLAQTVAVQNIDHWTTRDRGKPYADRKKGMLPPKLARIMVNLAVGEQIWLSPADLDQRIIYDPFCGTGTVLIEAALAGLWVAGSDLDVKSVLGSQENLDWLMEKLGREKLNLVGNFVTRDVTAVKRADIGASEGVDFIVTEPFLGKQTPNEAQLAGIFRGLEKLYWGAFRNWTTLLKPGAKIVMVWPRVVTRNKTYNLDALIDKIADLGYITSFKPVTYAREGAVIQRQIVSLEFKQK